ncbi:MAG: DUF2304 domain-containing protein [Candidatus Magasanikbacteria bacterium]
MVILFQILFGIFALFAIISVLQKWKKQMISLSGSFFWILFWLGSMTVVLWPEIVQFFADTLAIGRGSDLVLYVAVAMLFYLGFRLHVKIEGVNKELTKVARRLALDEVEKKDKK